MYTLTPLPISNNHVYLIYISHVYICYRECDISELIVPVCHVMLKHRKGSGTGLSFLCTFLLLRLSGDRAFSVKLTKPYMVCISCIL